MSLPGDDPLPERGRLLAVDVGNVRIGIAVCDIDRRMASPLETHQRGNDEVNARYFMKVAKVQEAVGFVVGLPLHMNGDEGSQVKEYRAFGAKLRTWTGLPVVFMDERCTSFVAETMLWDAGLTHKKRKARQDQVAAQLFLQSFLDSRRPAPEPKPEPTYKTAYDDDDDGT